jgi:hypothetical protein
MKILVDEMPEFINLCPFASEGIVKGCDIVWTCSMYPYICNFETGKSECNGLKVFKFSNEDMSVILRQALQPAT